MKSSSVLWRTLGIVSLVCLLAMLAGFGWALKDSWYPREGLALPEASAPEKAEGGDWSAKSELYVAALGDSLTKGTGDATGEGYVARTVASLAERMDKPVHLVNNMAVNGMRADQLAVRLDDKGFVNAVGRADIVLLTIGGNDLFQVAQGGGSLAEGGDLSPEALRERLPDVKPRLKEVFDKIRAVNPVARIVYVGLYNAFYDVPQMREAASRTVADWNGYAYELALADGNATVVPTYDLFEFRVTDYLSSDHFHPNALGYERIAGRIVDALQ
ncbi:GDSL-type esterase/lipase family protein [Cohnella cellulosilytica]|uniref:GDSL-type esterase/lipase family protein n=1 Tax=Cohnella cellulosilytica TaxID=986710 RepID=A0ABW2F1U3_9BACL